MGVRCMKTRWTQTSWPPFRVLRSNRRRYNMIPLRGVTLFPLLPGMISLAVAVVNSQNRPVALLFGALGTAHLAAAAWTRWRIFSNSRYRSIQESPQAEAESLGASRATPT